MVLNLRQLLFGLIITLGATSGSLAANAPDFALRDLSRSQSVADRVHLIEQFAHRHYFDPAGLMYSHMNWREERPFTAADFAATDSSIAGPEAYQWMSYENSVFISGVFLTAQCYRYQATHDPEALEFARQAYRSIEVNYRLSEQRDGRDEGPAQKAGIIDPSAQSHAAQAGFFCKPYYGRATDHTSTEQHFWPILGLYRFLPFASPEEKTRITQILREVSQRWRGNYKINYFGETWDMETSFPRAQRHMFLWAAIHRIAYEVTHDPSSLEEFQRLDALFGAIPTPRETAWGLGRPSYISTEDRSFHVQMVAGAEVLLALEPANRDRYLRGMKEWWTFSLIGQRDDLSSYYFIKIDSRTGAWEKLPKSVKPRALWRTSFMFQNATLPVCWFGTRERQSFTSAVVEHWVPETKEQAHARFTKIFRELDKENLHWFVDPENVMPDELRWMLNVLQGDSLAFYSLGYWYARASGVETL